METYQGSQQAYDSQAYDSQAYLSKQVNVNGKVITDQTINAAYDGKNLALDVYDNGKHFYSQLNNNDIASILSHRASSMPLEKRLMKDFTIKGKTYKNKSKSNKKKSKSNKKKSNSSNKKSNSSKKKSNKRKTYKKK
jgi:hypothetical protein